MKDILIALALLLSFGAQAQMTALDYDDSKLGLERNPLKGFATMFNLGGAVDTFPHSIRGELFPMDQLMFGPGQFEWDVIDDFLDEQEQNGNHVFFQVNVDQANGVSWMPQFIKDQMGEDEWYFQANTVFNEETMQNDTTFRDSIPNWNNELLFSSMLELVDSMGHRYDGDPRLFMAQIGLYGSWGEWNIPGEAVDAGYGHFQMTIDKQLELAARFEAAFSESYILARYPDNMPDPQAYGYSDGLFFAQSIHENNPVFFDNLLKNNSAYENWRLHPIGGEIRPEYQRYIWDEFPNPLSYPWGIENNETPQDVFQVLDSIRPTWLFAHHVIIKVVENSPANTTTTEDDPQDDPFHEVNAQEWDNAMRVHKALGYRLMVDSCRISAENGQPALEVNFNNLGLAPMYCDWDVEFAVLDAGGEVQSLGTVDWDIYSIMPDVEENYRSFISESTLADGTHTFLMRIVNPLLALSANAPSVTLNNASMDVDVEGWLTLGDATISAGTLGSHPVQVESVALNTATLDLPQGQSGELLEMVLPLDAENSAVTWISDHPATVSVDQNGQITALGELGETAIITVLTQDGGFIAECLVTITVFVPELPALIQAEDHVDAFGIGVEGTGDVGGGENVGNINPGHWIDFDVINTSAAPYILDIRAASGEAVLYESGGTAGGIMQILDETGVQQAALTFSTNQGWQSYETFSSEEFTLPVSAEKQRIRVFFEDGRYNLNWIEFRQEAEEQCTGDLDGDELVTVNDLLLLVSQWETTCDGCPADLTGDGFVDVSDLLLLVSVYNQTCDEIIGGMAPDEDVLIQRLDEEAVSALRSRGIDLTRISLFPNPAGAAGMTLSLQGMMEASSAAELQIMDIQGRVLQHRAVQLLGSSDNIAIDTKGLSAGLYLLQVNLGGVPKSIRFEIR